MNAKLKNINFEGLGVEISNQLPWVAFDILKFSLKTRLKKHIPRE